MNKHSSWLKFFTLLLVVGFCASCGGGGGGGENSSGSDACSVVSSGGRKLERIINGDQCERGNTAVVRIRLFNSANRELGSCSGTAITQTAILTAAHCFEGGATNVIVETGNASIPSGSIFVDPDFSSVDAAQLRDAAVIKVSQNLGTQTFPLLTSRNAQVGEEAIIAGYGDDENGDSGVLRAGPMIVSRVRNTLISADFTGSGSNTCFGDSGGPFLVSQGGAYAIAGLTSSGILDSCDSGDVSTFTNISSARTLNFILGVASGAATL